MLVLPHANRLWIDLYQFTQRVQQPAANAYRPPDRDILIRESLPRYLAGRIDRGATFIDHKNMHRHTKIDAPHELLRLSAGSAIAHTDGLDGILVHQPPQFGDTPGG